MRRSDRQVTDPQKIDAIIRMCKVCRLGFVEQDTAYIVPLNFGYVSHGSKRTFYFHSAQEGRKISLARKASRVSFEMDTDLEIWEANTACAYTAGYRSVMGIGCIRWLERAEDKEMALNEIMSQNTGKKGWKFSEAGIAAVAVFELEVTEISCKEHIKR